MDNSFTITAEARISALETSIKKLTNLLQKTTNQDNKTLLTEMQS